MPNQSISEAECKRLAQVLEPKALPALYQSPSHQEHGPVTRPLGAAGVVNNHQGCQMAVLTAGRLKLIERNKDVA